MRRRGELLFHARYHDNTSIRFFFHPQTPPWADMLFIPLHTWKTKAWSVYITHLLTAWITTRSGWREALEHEYPSLGFLLLGWGNLVIPAPLCVLEFCHAILDLSCPQTMLGPQAGRGLGQPLESLNPYTTLSFQVLSSLPRSGRAQQAKILIRTKGLLPIFTPKFKTVNVNAGSQPSWVSFQTSFPKFPIPICSTQVMPMPTHLAAIFPSSVPCALVVHVSCLHPVTPLMHHNKDGNYSLYLGLPRWCW